MQLEALLSFCLVNQYIFLFMSILSYSKQSYMHEYPSVCISLSQSSVVRIHIHLSLSLYLWYYLFIYIHIYIYIQGQEKQMEMLTPSKPQINRQLIWLQVHFMFWKCWLSPCTCSREQFQFFSLLSNSTQLQPQDFCHTNLCLKLANLRYVCAFWTLKGSL